LRVRAPHTEGIAKTVRAGGVSEAVDSHTGVEEPFGTVERASSGTYGVTGKTFAGALAPTAGARGFINARVAIVEEDTGGGLRVRGHEENSEDCQKEKSSSGEHPCVMVFLSEKKGRRGKSEGVEKDKRGWDGMKGSLFSTQGSWRFGRKTKKKKERKRKRKKPKRKRGEGKG